MTALAQALNAALLHFVWQGIAVGALLGIALFALRKSSANSRYVVSCAALVVLALAPIITAMAAYEPQARSISSIRMGDDSLVPDSISIGTPVYSHRATGLAGLQSWVLPLWALGVSVFALRLMWCWGHTAALRRTGTPAESSFLEMVARAEERLGVRRKIRVLMSSVAEVPSVIGWMRPVLLLPVAVAAGLTPEQLEALIVHELAHIRRHDYLVNLGQTIVETVLFYHPVVWWVSSKIRYERELCCDDLAVTAMGDAAGYARALAKLEELRVFQPNLAMGAANGPLLHRIERLLGGDGRSSGPSRLACAVGLFIGIACWAVTLSMAQDRNRIPNGDFVEDYWIAMPPMPPMPPMPAMPPMPPMSLQEKMAFMSPEIFVVGGMQQIPQDFRLISESSANLRYVLFRGNDVISTATGLEEEEARKARQAAGNGDFFWFRLDGKTYTSRDKATMTRVEELQSGVNAINDSQRFLRSQQQTLDKQVELLARRFQSDASLKQSQVMLQSREKMVETEREIQRARAEIAAARAQLESARAQYEQVGAEIARSQAELNAHQVEIQRALIETMNQVGPEIRDYLREAIGKGKAQEKK